MAEVFRLESYDASSTLVDLYGGTLKLEYKSFTPRTPAVVGTYKHTLYGAQPEFEHFGVVVENLRLLGEGTPAELRSALDEVEDVLEGVRDYHRDPIEGVSYFLRWNTDGESAKRALIYEGSVQFPAEDGATAFMEDGKLHVMMYISRHPLWEDPTYALKDCGNLSCLGGKATITNIPGTAPARIFRAQFGGVDGNSGSGEYKIWCGIRKKYEGYDNFEPLWECEDGTGWNDTTSTSDASASGGYKMRCTFSTSSALLRRWQMSVQQVCAANSHTDYNHQRGKYLALLRCKLSAASSTVGMQLQTGYTSSNFRAEAEKVYISSTTWNLVELGEVSIPPGGSWYNQGVGYVQDFTIFIYAERLEGAAALDLDAVVLIPSKYCAVLEGSQVYYSGGDKHPALVYTLENDTTLAVGLSADRPSHNLALNTTEWYLPPGDSVLVVASTTETVQILPNQLDVDLAYYPRWKSFRV